MKGHCPVFLTIAGNKKKYLFTVYIRGANGAGRHRKILELFFSSDKLLLLHSQVKLSFVISLEISVLADIFIFRLDTCFPFPLLSSPTEATEKKNIVGVIRIHMLKYSHLEMEHICQYTV